MICELEDKIFGIQNEEFEQLALDIFQFQYAGNAVYRSFTDALHIDPRSVRNVASIPFMPIGFFKNHRITTGFFDAETTFESSGTTATGNSKHLVKSLDLYRQSFLKAFQLFYGEPADLCIIGLLPSYLERSNSSLVLMVKELIAFGHHPNNGFYLYEHERLAKTIAENEAAQQKTLLIGVTFALIDFAGYFSSPLKHTAVMETGGMKGRRKELTRSEVHDILKSAWSLENIHSEYGMTELLSQAYSLGDGIFRCPPWMKILLRDEDDPLTIKTFETKSVNGLINVIDLANIYSCSFIATDDLGKLNTDGSFEVTGRMDSSDVRGCSLMYHV